MKELKEGDRIHGRFEVVKPPFRFAPLELRDVTTGRAAVMATTGYFLEDASSFAMASWVKSQEREDLAEVLALRPTVLAWGRDEGKPSPRELGELTITLLERAFDLGAEGITCEPRLAWIVRRGEGWDVVLPAGLGHGGELHFDQRVAAQRWPRAWQILQACLGWLEARLRPAPPRLGGPPPRTWFSQVKTVPEAIAGLAREVGAPELADHAWRERAAPFQRIDFALAEELGEAALREAPEEGYRRAYVGYPLAALLHRRACVELPRDAQAALVTVERAIALDPCARHLTTRALVLEALGRDDEARAAHEAAVAALPALREVAGFGPIGDDDSVHDARTAHGWGAFLARHGDLAAARPWLQRAIVVPDLLGPDPQRAMRLAALAVVLFRQGERERAAQLAAEALALDPAEPSALAVHARL